MDWNNLEFDRLETMDANVLDGLTFMQLFTQIDCNLPVLTEEAIEKEFNDQLDRQVQEAKDIFKANKKAITRKARKLRKK